MSFLYSTWPTTFTRQVILTRRCWGPRRTISQACSSWTTWTARCSESRECFAEHRQAFGDGDGGVFAAFEFQCDVAAVFRVAQDRGDARIVQVERVPGASAVVSLGLDERRFGREQRQSIVRVFKKVARVQRHAE